MMAKNYWRISEDHAVFDYKFSFSDNQYNTKILISVLELVVRLGMKYEVFKILDPFDNKTDLSEKYIEQSRNSILEADRKGVFMGGDFFIGTTPIVYNGIYLEDYKDTILFKSYCKLAYYDENNNLAINDIFDLNIFYPLLNPYRVHLYHDNETGTDRPISLEMVITKEKKLRLSISSGLGIWSPYLKPDYDMDKQSLKDFPLNEYGLIDNRELYLLNTPRLLGFIKEIRAFFKLHGGTEAGNNSKLDRFPEFPWYYGE